jgi:hypothetical protein
MFERTNEVRHGAPEAFDMKRERSRAVACTGLVASIRPLLASWRLGVRTKCSMLPHAKTLRRQDPDYHLRQQFLCFSALFAFSAVEER